MAHTLANDKTIAAREADEVEICIIDPDQEDQIKRLRDKLSRYWKPFEPPCVTPASATVRKRLRGR